MKWRSPNLSLWLATSAAVALVLFRSFVFLCYEQNFDSDQAIVGLMAKHLSEFRAFPLFFYGQDYMLGVESWIAVPFFWLGGPTVTMLRLPLVLINVAVVILLIRLLTASGLRPSLAFTAALPIAACGPVAAGELLTALGASVEPLLYVILLWICRARPVPFGILLCIGSLHREFTMFALPAIVVLEWLEFREVRWPAVLKSTAAFGATWLAIDQLKRYINIAVPGAEASTGTSGSLIREVVQLGTRLLSFRPTVYLARLHLLVTHGLPDLFGARPLTLFAGGIWGNASVGSWFAGGAIVAATTLCAARLLWIIVKGRARSARFPVFLALVSVQAIVAYGVHGGTNIEPRPELNYVLLVLLLPVALFGAYLLHEADNRYRRTAVVLIAAWALLALGDNARVAEEYIVSPPPSAHRVLADYLMKHRIRYAWATYWDSYRVTFLSKERVIVASTDTVRIPEYQARVERDRLNAVRIVRLPCDEGTHVAEWCLIDPFKR